MRSSCNDIRVREGGRNSASGNQSADMGHVRHEIRSHFVSNLSHAFVVNEPTIGARSSDEDFWSVERCGCFKSIIIDYSSVLVDSVWHSLKISARRGDFFGVGLITCGRQPPSICSFIP